MMGKYYINGIDIFTDFGLAPQPGVYNELLKLPIRKGGYTYNWPDQHGTERDLTDVYYETRTLDLKFYLIASGESDFWQKYNALRAFLLASKYVDLDVTDMNKRFILCYSNMTEFEKISIIKNNNKKILAALTVTMQDDFPTLNISPSESIIDKFIENVTADGGTADKDLLLQIFNEQ